MFANLTEQDIHHMNEIIKIKMEKDRSVAGNYIKKQLKISDKEMKFYNEQIIKYDDNYEKIGKTLEIYNNEREFFTDDIYTERFIKNGGFINAYKQYLSEIETEIIENNNKSAKSKKEVHLLNLQIFKHWIWIIISIITMIYTFLDLIGINLKTLIKSLFDK